MRMILCLTAVALAACAMPAGAQSGSEDTAMGIYEGQFTSGAWNGQPLVVQIVPRGNGAYNAVFPFDAGTPRVSVGGKLVDGTLPLNGKVDLGAAKDGEFRVNAELAAGVIEGEFTGAAGASAFRADKVVRVPPTYDQKPPEGAIVLLDGNNLDAWQRWPEKWVMVEEGAMQVCGSNLVTKEHFGSCDIHIEFRTPYMPKSSGQGRGNSGVYVLGRYEVQVLDSFGEEPADNLCGGIYKLAVPIADACLPPLQWQTYDISFDAPSSTPPARKPKTPSSPCTTTES